MSAAKRKTEDSADGCRGLAQADRARAATMTSEHMRAVLERSADAWSARARLLDRLEKDFTKRVAAAQTDNPRGMKIGDEANG
jgi:hypothetical protein